MPAQNPLEGRVLKSEVHRSAEILRGIAEQSQFPSQALFKALEDLKGRIIGSVIDDDDLVNDPGDREHTLLDPIFFVLDGHHRADAVGSVALGRTKETQFRKEREQSAAELPNSPQTLVLLWVESPVGQIDAGVAESLPFA